MIHFDNVKKVVDGREVLTDLTLFLPKASYTLICGDGQSGKTTLVRLLMAYEKPDQGTLTVDGIEIGSIPDVRIPFLRRQIGLISQTPVLLEDRTVSENISLPLELAGFDRDITTQRLDSMLARTGLHDDSNIKVNRLTATARQLVSAARATVHQPPIVVADEPLHRLDDETADLLVTLLHEANTGGATVLVTSQSSERNNDRLTAVATILELNAGSVTDNEHNQFKRDTID